MRMLQLLIYFLMVATLTCCVATDKTSASKMATPEEIVDKIQDELLDEVLGNPKSYERKFEEIHKRNLDEAEKLIAEFRKLYREHELRWAVLCMEASLVTSRADFGLPQAKQFRPALDIYAQISTAKDAPESMRMNASSTMLFLLSKQVYLKKIPLETWEKILSKHLAAFPFWEDNKSLIETRLSLIDKMHPARLPVVLNELANSSNQMIAKFAKEKIECDKERLKRMSIPREIKIKEPVGLEFDM